MNRSTGYSCRLLSQLHCVYVHVHCRLEYAVDKGLSVISTADGVHIMLCYSDCLPCKLHSFLVHCLYKGRSGMVSVVTRFCLQSMTSSYHLCPLPPVRLV